MGSEAAGMAAVLHRELQQDLVALRLGGRDGACHGCPVGNEGEVDGRRHRLDRGLRGGGAKPHALDEKSDSGRAVVAGGLA